MLCIIYIYITLIQRQDEEAKLQVKELEINIPANEYESKPITFYEVRLYTSR